MKKGSLILLVALSALIILIAVAQPALAYQAECSGCHLQQYNKMNASNHSTLACETCHEGADAHFNDLGTPKTVFPKVHFDMEICMGCHPDQYRTFRTDLPGRTFYGGSDGGPNPPRGWSKTVDLPYWNALIDGHPFVEETYEERPMMWNQIDAQETIRPKSEACLECHGTKIAYIMGVNFTDSAGNPVQIPAKAAIVNNTQSIPTGSVVFNASTGAWDPIIINLTVPQGTMVSTYTDAVNEPRYQVKSIVKVPQQDGSTRIYATYDCTLTGECPYVNATGTDPVAVVANEARNWIYAALQAVAFDGLDYAFTKALAGEAYEGTGYNWPSVEAGELCNNCHDPMAAKLRIVKKSLIEGIARNGINPYSMQGSLIKDFDKATKQDQIIAICGQCHSEYVGGYSAVDRIDRDYFPWARPDELEALYTNIFNFNQDWRHGKPVSPWQTTNPNDRGYYPAGSLAPIGETLIKSQHPEAETYWNSVMYDAGATCTTCHTISQTNITTSKQYTNHSFTSPYKIFDEMGILTCDSAGCHGPTDIINPGGPMDTATIKMLQDTFFDLQNQTQLALVDRMKTINQSKSAGIDVAEQVQDYKKAHLRWEYFAQGENAMGFHNFLLARNDMNAALNNKWSVKGAPYASTQGTPGLSIPSVVWLGGSAGSLWVSDQVMGFCRVDNTGGVFDVDQNTCILGDGAGLVPGPMIPGQASFDAVNNVVYVPDTDAAGTELISGIWKMDYDPATNTVSNPVLIADVSMLGFRDATGLLVGEPAATALGSDGSLYIGSIVSPYIVKISNPGTPAQVINSSWGTTQSTGETGFVASLAFAGTKLYIVDTLGTVTSISAATGGEASTVFGLIGLAAATSVASDGVNTLYIGDTSSVKKYTISTSTLVSYASTGRFPDGTTTPFQLLITSLSLDTAGNLFVADDPGTDAFFSGRAWKVTPASAPVGTLYSPIHSPGISMPGGLVWMGDQANGNMWIADGWLGLCRLDKNTAGAAVINENTCIMGDGYTAPMTPSHPVFDAVKNFLYIPDSGATVPDMVGVWRYTYDPATKMLINGVPIAYNTDLNALEPIASALGPDGSLYIGFLQEYNIAKITNPDTTPTVINNWGSTYGTTDPVNLAPGVFDITVAGQYLYLAEPNGVARISLSTGGTAASFSTKLINPATNMMTDVLPSAIIASGDKLFIAEMPSMESPIQLYNISTDTIFPYSTTGVLPDGRIMPYRAAYALGFDTTGKLYVADDPTNDITAQTFKGRVWEVQPVAKIVVSPLSATLNVTETQIFIATAKDIDGNLMAGVDIAWSINNAAAGNVAPIITTTGIDGTTSATLTASGGGVATVAAVNGTVGGTATVTVNQPPVPPVTANLTVFARGLDNGVWTRNWNGNVWSGWQSLGGIVASNIAAASAGINITIFARGEDNGVWTRNWNGSVWSNWQSLGGIVTSEISATSSGSNIDIFVRGADNSVWTQNWNGNVWSGWQNLGGIVASNISSSAQAGNITIFGRGTDNGLWTRNSNGAVWSNWQSLGGIVASDPDSISVIGGRTYVFIPGPDNAVWTQNWNGSVWSGWQNLGGIVASSISSSAEAGNVTIFARGADNGLWTRNSNGAVWSNWQSVGGNVASDPDSISVVGGRTYVFIRASDNAVWTQNWNGNVWSGWQSLGGLTTGEPEVVS